MGADGALVKRRGRPTAAWRMRRFGLMLSLHPVADAALIAALEGAPRGRRATLVREWLRAGRPVEGGDAVEERPDLADLGVEL